MTEAGCHISRLCARNACGASQTSYQCIWYGFEFFAVGSRLRRLVVRMLRQRMTFTTDTSFRRVLWSLRTSGKYNFCLDFVFRLAFRFEGSCRKTLPYILNLIYSDRSDSWNQRKARTCKGIPPGFHSVSGEGGFHITSFHPAPD